MSVLTPGRRGPLAVPPYPIYKLSVDGYHKMIEAGILTEDDPVELLEGWLVEKMVHNPPHDATIQIANETISVCLPRGWQCAEAQAAAAARTP